MLSLRKDNGERQGEKEPNTRTKHKAIICIDRNKFIELIADGRTFLTGLM